MMRIDVRPDGDGRRVSTVNMEGTTEDLLIDLVCAEVAVLIKLMQDGVLLPDVDHVTDNIRDNVRDQLRHDLQKFMRPGMGSDDTREGLTQ